MSSTDTIKAIDAHADKYNLTVQSIGQMAIKNRHAYDRIKSGTAQVNTERRILEWIEADRAARQALAS